MTSFIDILDTAVKIGLGALISGVTTYWVSTSKNRHELNYEMIKRRLNLLDKVAEQIELFYHDYLMYNGKVWQYVLDDATKKEFPKGYKSSLKESYEKVKDTTTQFSSGLSRLLLIGEKDSYKAARELGNIISDHMEKTYETEKPLTVSEIEGKKNEVVEKKETLFKKLSESYDSQWVSRRRN